MNEILLNTNLKIYITQLKLRNDERSTAMKSINCSEYNRMVLTHKYNNTVEIIRDLESILNKCQ